MELNRIYPCGVQTFSDIMEEGMVYVDKTALIYNMVKKYKYVFLSRPRRFGKSLLSSTLDSYFSGRKDLFKGLSMEQLEKDWTEYPVFHFDLSTFKNCNHSLFPEKFDLLLSELEEKYGITNTKESAGNRFSQLIKQAEQKTGKKVVIILDEYDALPLLYQSGYLTIKSYDPLTNGYYLGIPNQEVRAGLMENLLPVYSGVSDGKSLGPILEIRTARHCQD